MGFFVIKFLNSIFFSAILNTVITGFVTDNAGKPRNTNSLYFWAFFVAIGHARKPVVEQAGGDQMNVH